MSPPREFTDVEISQLSSNGITSLTALWEQVGNDFDRGLPIVHTATGVAVSRLREVLASKGGRDFEIVGESLGKPQGAWGRQTRQAVKRYWLEIIGAVFLLFIIFLVLRATGLTQRWPAPFGIRERVVVAARRLEAGSVIRDGDLFAARLPSGEGYFHDTGELSGLILAARARNDPPTLQGRHALAGGCQERHSERQGHLRR
jgi:hypothetical protein